jgi:hypothetical protein
MKAILDLEELRLLREAGVIEIQEVAYQSGDIYVAENVVTGEKRVIEAAPTILAESNRRILKG